MNTITKRTIAVAVSVAAIAATVAPSFAQTRSQRTVLQPPRIQEPFVQQAQPGSGQYSQYAVPGYHNPYECRTDEGNGRWSTCDR